MVIAVLCYGEINMKSGDKVKAVRASHHIYVGQTVEVVDIVSQYRVKVKVGFVEKVVDKSDLAEVIVY